MFGMSVMIFSELECPVLQEIAVVAAPDQVSNDLDGETVILNVKTGQYYGVTAVEARIWDMLQAPISVKDIKDSLVETYKVEPARCKEDVLAFLQELSDEGLIDVHE
jgi:hypothetical protein